MSLGRFAEIRGCGHGLVRRFLQELGVRRVHPRWHELISHHTFAEQHLVPHATPQVLPGLVGVVAIQGNRFALPAKADMQRVELVRQGGFLRRLEVERRIGLVTPIRIAVGEVKSVSRGNDTQAEFVSDRVVSAGQTLVHLLASGRLPGLGLCDLEPWIIHAVGPGLVHQHFRIWRPGLDDVVQLPRGRPVGFDVMAADTRLLNRDAIPRLGLQNLPEAALVSVGAFRGVFLVQSVPLQVRGKRGAADGSGDVNQLVPAGFRQLREVPRGILRETVADSEKPNGLRGFLPVRSEQERCRTQEDHGGEAAEADERIQHVSPIRG